MKSRRNYIEKLKKSKKINDFLLMRKKRAKSHAIQSWPPEENLIQPFDLRNISAQCIKTNGIAILTINNKVCSLIKEIGLIVINPKEENNKITIKSKEKPFKFKRISQQLKYAGVFHPYFILENNEEIEMEQSVINVYSTSNHNEFSESKYYCNFNQNAYLEINSESLTQKYF